MAIGEASPEAGAMDTLQAMFGENWDAATLQAVLASKGGDVEAAVDAVLAAGTPEAWQAAAAAPPPPPAAPSPPPSAAASPAGGALAPGAVSVVVPEGSRGGSTLSMSAHGRQFMVQVPPGLVPGQRFVATIPQPRAAPPAAPLPVDAAAAAAAEADALPKRGTPVQLPDDFLRLPDDFRPASSGTDAMDQQLALMMQQQQYAEPGAAPRGRGFLGRPRPAASGAAATSAGPAASQGGTSSIFNRMSAAASSAAASAGRAGAAIKSKLKSRDAVHIEPFEQQYGRLDIGDELDDGNPLHHEAATPPGQNGGSPNRGQDELEL